MTWTESAASPFLLPDLAGKTAVVTGASMGIGKAVTSLLLDNGTKVFGISRQCSSLNSANLIQIECDLLEMESIARAFEAISAQTDHVDYIVNVAGMDPKYSIDEITVEQWDSLIDLNLRAYYFVIKLAMPLLRRSLIGQSIVNVSSINYRLGIPGRAPYSATKAGIIGITTGLARELGREGIRINTVSPGWIFTERQIKEYFESEESERHLAYLGQKQALKLKITSGDIANHVLFYLSHVSRASTGHNCVVDGGWLLE